MNKVYCYCCCCYCYLYLRCQALASRANQSFVLVFKSYMVEQLQICICFDCMILKKRKRTMKKHNVSFFFVVVVQRAVYSSWRNSACKTCFYFPKAGLETRHIFCVHLMCKLSLFFSVLSFLPHIQYRNCMLLSMKRLGI